MQMYFASDETACAMPCAIYSHACACFASYAKECRRHALTALHVHVRACDFLRTRNGGMRARPHLLFIRSACILCLEPVPCVLHANKYACACMCGQQDSMRYLRAPHALSSQSRGSSRKHVYMHLKRTQNSQTSKTQGRTLWS